MVRVMKSFEVMVRVMGFRLYKGLCKTVVRSATKP